MSDTPDRESKQHEPTQRKLDQARQEGQVIKSQEIATFASLVAAVTVLLTMGGGMARGVAQDLVPFIAHPEAIDLSGGGGMAVMRQALKAAQPGLIILLAAAAAGAAGNLLQHGFLFVPSKLAPDFKKLNPMEGLKRLFGPSSLMQFAKTFVRFIAMSLIVWMVLKPHVDLVRGMAQLDPAAILPLTLELTRAMFIAALVLLAVSAAVDWVLQRRQFMTQMRMTREEVKQEQKDQEGDPHLKAKIKQIRVMRAKRRIIQNVPKATLVITNPTHFAVALRYVQGETAVPICVAKGSDELALKIREIAGEHKIPIVENPPLARALFATVEIDDAIPREHYQAVAKVVGFVMGAAKRRARPTRPAPRAARF